MEARLRLDSSRRGQGSFLKIQAVTEVDDHVWWTECQFNNGESDYPFYFCNIHKGEGQDSEPVFEYQTKMSKVIMTLGT
jgi:hypothetical protein